ncbi:hypothetical protein ACFZAU_03595 [Streptomyces sp. NPDC008238]
MGGVDPAALSRPGPRAQPAPDLGPAPAPAQGLGKRQENLLTGVLRGIPLMGQDTMVPFAEADVRSCLAQFRPSEHGAAAGLVNRVRPSLLDAVVGRTARLQGYVRGLPEGGVEPLLDVVSKAVYGPLALRVVFGASVRMPLRAMSYVLPAVLMAERILAVTGRLPYLQVLYVGELGARINALPAPVVAEEGRLLVEHLGRVLGRGPMAGHYELFTDLPLPADEDPIGDLLTRLREEPRAEIARRLHGKGGSLSDRQTLEYAAAHVLLHDLGRLPLRRVGGTTPPDAGAAGVIDLGGVQERHFHRVRAVFAQALGHAAPGPLVLTRHSVPPYTMSRVGDVGLREFLDGVPYDEAALPAAVRHDLQLLRAGRVLDHLR